MNWRMLQAYLFLLDYEWETRKMGMMPKPIEFRYMNEIQNNVVVKQPIEFRLEEINKSGLLRNRLNYGWKVSC